MIKKHHKLVNAWFNKAEKDLITVEHEFFFDDPVYETICFHCQQAVEKFLKGYLIYLEIGYQKTHELGELVSVCERKDRGITHLKEDADKLTDYAVEIRYPDDYYEIYEDDAKEAFEIAKEVKAYIYSKVSR
jgi:HEPN domain-containing protein